MNPSVIVYQVGMDTFYLLSAILPDAVIVRALIPHTANRILKALPITCRNFFFHLDITLSHRMPLKRRSFVKALRHRGITVWNEHSTNISKRFIQDTLRSVGLNTTRLRKADVYEGDVIIKSNPNYGGAREKALDPLCRAVLGIPNYFARAPKSDAYQVCARTAVPDYIWSKPELVVERYISNGSHTFFRAHMLGTAIIISKVHDPTTLKKMSRGKVRHSLFVRQTSSSIKVVQGRRVSWQSIVKQVAAARIAFNLDFGAMDIVCNRKRLPFIVDVNTTPFWGNADRPEMIAFLRSGLDGVTSNGRHSWNA